MSESRMNLDFRPAERGEAQARMVRPSLSYWQDAWRRLKLNPRAVMSLFLVIGLLLFTLVGPLLWRVNPSDQDLDQVSMPPGADRSAVIAAAYAPWQVPESVPGSGLRLDGPATTQAVRLVWDEIPECGGLRSVSRHRPAHADGTGAASRRSAPTGRHEL